MSLDVAQLANNCLLAFGAWKRCLLHVFSLRLTVQSCCSQPTRDAMDLAYLPGQRPQDTLVGYDKHDIRENVLLIGQGKTGKKLRMEVTGELKAVIERIWARKTTYKVVAPHWS